MDLAVDLGTAVMRVASAESVLATPSEIGRERPLRGGVVVDRLSATEVLRPLVHHAQGPGLGRPRVVTCIPTGTTADERAAVVEVVRRAGASRVAVVAEPIAAAIGAGLDLASPYAQMIVDAATGLPTRRSFGPERSCWQRRSAWPAGPRGGGDRPRADPAADRPCRPTKRCDCCGGCGSTLKLAAWDGRRRRKAGPRSRSTSPIWPQRCGRFRTGILGVVGDLVRRAPARVGAELVESGIALTGGRALVPGRGLPASLAARTGLAVRVGSPRRRGAWGARAAPTVARLDLWE